MKDNPCIRIGHLKIVDHLILGIAGLELEKNSTPPSHFTFEPIAMNSWDQICAGLTTKTIDGAFITVPLALDLFSSGLDIRLLMFTHRSGSSIVKNNAAGIRRIADFRDKAVLVPSTYSVQHMLVHRLLASAGLLLGSHGNKAADVVCETANPFLMGEMVRMDKDGDIAGFAVEEPFGSEAIQNGTVTLVCASENLWKNHPCCGFVLHASFIKQFPEAVGEIVSLFARTGHSLETDFDSNSLFMAQLFLEQKKEVIREIFLKKAVNFDPHMMIPDMDALDTIQTYMTDSMGTLREKINISLLVDSSFILNAISENNY